MIMHKALHPRDNKDYMCQRKEEEDMLALRIALMHQYNDSRIISRRAKKE